MYCPECGADAGAAKFCPECGADLRVTASAPVCEACGSEVPAGARFCPECGEPAGAAGDAGTRNGGRAAAAAAARPSGGRRTGTRGKSAGGAQQRRQQPRAQQVASGKSGRPPAAPSRPAGRVSPPLAWGVIIAIVVIGVLAVVYVVSGHDGGAGSTASSSASSPTPVAADTQGSYDELVQRANGLYDQGAAKFDAKQYAQGTAYFEAASTVYGAAWKKQNTDPGVGTDYATSLFYSGKIDAALAQVDKVLAQSPSYQTAWFNKGNYLAQKASDASNAGDDKAAKNDYAAARTAYQKAIDLGPSTPSGQNAKEQLSQLPK